MLHTPGHTIESISILVFDLAEDKTKPYAVLTGDTLFIGDVGRPDLRASLGWTANELGGHLYDSLHNKLLAASRRSARLSGPWRGFALRQEALFRYRLVARRSATLELRAASP